MNDDDPQGGAQAKQDKSTLLGRMIRIVEQESTFVGEDRRCLSKGDSVLPSIRDVLGMIPLESELSHGQSIIML